VHQGKGALIVGGNVEAIKAKEMEARQRTTLSDLAAETEPELDQFMEAYHEMLVKFTRKMEPQLNSLSISGRSLHNTLSPGHWRKKRHPHEHLPKVGEDGRLENGVGREVLKLEAELLQQQQEERRDR
jgi:phosphoenolpyruvate synthase/pyruvate phosphate dikinase